MIKKIIGHTFWLMIGSSIGRLVMLSTNIFVARMLSQELFGQFTMIRNTISMFEVTVSGALGPVATRNIAKKNSINSKKVLSVVLSLFIINLVIVVASMFLIFIFRAYIIENFFLGQNSLIQALYIGIFILFVNTFASLVQSILIGLESYKSIAISSIIVSTLSIPIIFYLIYRLNLYGALFGVFIYFLLDFLFKLYYIYKKMAIQSIVFEIQSVIRDSYDVLKTSSLLLLSVLINSIAFWYARILLINNTQEFKSLAIFDAAFQWLSIIILITGSTTSVVLPMLSRTLKLDDKNYIFSINILFNLAIAITIGIIFILFSSEIMSIYGKNYIKGSNVLIVLSYTSVVFTLALLFNRYMVAISQTYVVLFAAIIGVISMYATLFFTLSMGSLGLAWGFFSYYFSGVILYIIIFFKTQRST